MVDKKDDNVPFLRGNIETEEQARKVVTRAANAFLILCGLMLLAMCLKLIQHGTAHNRIGEYIGTIIGNATAIGVFAIPALILKGCYSHIAAKFLLVLCGLCFAFGVYVLFVPGIFSGNYAISMSGALMVMWWACFIRLSLRADYAAKVIHSTPEAA